MSIRKIYQYPEPVLRQKGKKIGNFTPELKTLIEDMAETRYDAPGIGLAEQKVGESLQLLIVDTSTDKEN